MQLLNIAKFGDPGWRINYNKPAMGPTLRQAVCVGTICLVVAQRELAMHNLYRRNVIRLGFLVAVLPFVTPIPFAAAEPTPLAIEGYDPVAYFTAGRAVRGLPKIAYEWDEHSYLFFERAQASGAFSRLIRCTTRLSSETSARWPFPEVKSSWQIQKIG